MMRPCLLPPVELDSGNDNVGRQESDRRPVENPHRHETVSRRPVLDHNRITQHHVLSEVGSTVRVVGVARYLRAHPKGQLVSAVIAERDGIGILDLATLHVDQHSPGFASFIPRAAGKGEGGGCDHNHR